MPTKPKAEKPLIASESVSQGTERAIAAAPHLTDLDAGLVAALRKCAAKIDEGGTDGALLAYLKYCEALGLTPISAIRDAIKPRKDEPETDLARLRRERADRTG